MTLRRSTLPIHAAAATEIGNPTGRLQEAITPRLNETLVREGLLPSPTTTADPDTVAERLGVQIQGHQADHPQERASRSVAATGIETTATEVRTAGVMVSDHRQGLLPKRHGNVVLAPLARD